MLENNNQIAIKRISKRSMKNNRTRNIFAIIAIILTTFMFTTIFSIGFSMAKNMSITMTRQQGTKSSIYINNPTDDQIKTVQNTKGVNAAGVQVHVDNYIDQSDDNNTISLKYYDNTEFNKNLTPAISDIEGTYPINANEIMLSESALNLLGIENPKKNMEVVIDLENSGETTFALSGWYKDYQYLSHNSLGLVSEKYVSSKNFTAEKDGMLSISCKLDKNNLVYDELSKMALNDGQEVTAVFDFQSETGSNTIIIAVIILVIGLIIITSGYLLIYNVMYISVTKDIRFFGMLKTIGTSPKQIKKIVTMQAFRLSVIGIPIGIVLGALVSFLAVPLSQTFFSSSITEAMPTDITFNPFIYIGTIIFALFTILLSCKKPAKFASSVSPVEALKYNGSNNNKIKSKKTTNGGKLYKMAFRNVFREKKRAILVFASLFMGTVAFLSVSTFFGSLKIENYINHYLPHDYSAYFLGDTNENISSSKKVYENLKAIKGITNIKAFTYTKADATFDKETFNPYLVAGAESAETTASDVALNFENGENPYTIPVTSISVEDLKKYNEKNENKVDIDAFEKGEVVIISSPNQTANSSEMIGKTISIKDQISGNNADVKIASEITRDFDNGFDFEFNAYSNILGAPEYLIVSESFLEKFNSDLIIDKVNIDCEEDSEPFVTAKFKELVDNNALVYGYTIKSEDIADFKTSMSSMGILTNGMSAILILIGVINFVNVMVTGVFTRRQELAVMESVGMTKKQIRKMLMFEGVYYAVITSLLIMTLGNAIIFLLANLAKKIADYAAFYYPFGLMAGIVAMIFAICIIVPAIIYKQFAKESVTKRLKLVE